MELQTTNPHCFIYQTEEMLIELVGGVRVEGLDRMRVTMKVTVVNRKHAGYLINPELAGLSVRHNLDLYNDTQVEKFVKSSLSCGEIRIEDILKKGLPSLNSSSKINQQKGCPNISKKPSKYCRQYFGFINAKGEKVIWINMFWNRDLNERAKSELINVNDGCSYYWSIEVNLTSRTLSNLQINGNG